MAVVEVSCPGCKQKYKLTANDPVSLVNQNFNCKKCGFTASFRLVLPKNIVAKANQRPHLETHIVGAGGNAPTETGGTRNPAIAGGAGAKTTVSGQQSIKAPHLIVNGTNMDFTLLPGIYIIGRNSLDSKATLKLTPDMYMSREHAKLVVEVANGVPVSKITGLKPNNPIMLGNGKALPHGAVLTLSDGNVLKFGNTVVKYVIK